ncbi:hypothetical protein MM440_08460 [Arsenicicoccus piscis]|uniref:hypothetical protein n=1 Tax=Arsenicicoccus piscis TaxID=673954 RepID=UPI001F4C6F54|nr:hypothetical protein [Arsenicicoccus piscis]MCH8627816.1 hypothetical protein [Arsenicicoccus piscis]
MAVALTGLVTVWSGTVTGPVALVAPTLLAVAVGLVLAHLMVPLAARIAVRRSADGRVRSTLVALAIARRPTVRRTLAIVTVATSLAAFSAAALVAGDLNREQRAAVETGAPVVLTTDAHRVGPVVEAVQAADPGGHRAPPSPWCRRVRRTRSRPSPSSPTGSPTWPPSPASATAST